MSKLTIQWDDNGYDRLQHVFELVDGRRVYLHLINLLILASEKELKEEEK